MRRKVNRDCVGVLSCHAAVTTDDGHVKPQAGLFEKYQEGRTPFDPQTEEDDNEDLMEDTNGVRSSLVGWGLCRAEFLHCWVREFFLIRGKIVWKNQ